MLVIDRIWNGELFLVSENLLLDLALGFAMTLAVSLFWAVAVIVTVIRKPANTL